VESPEVPFDDEAWPHPEGERLNEVPTPPFSSLYSQSHAYYQVNLPLSRRMRLLLYSFVI
ncbi:disks large homolog 1 isoform X1, partial [Lates japonicus]